MRASTFVTAMKQYMSNPVFSRMNATLQYIVSVAAVMLAALLCYFIFDLAGYRLVAFILLLVVSLVAMFFRIGPVLLAAVSSALIWDIFFIPPRFSLRVTSTEDLLMLLMYFIVALVNGVLTYKIRQVENAARKQEEKERTLQLYNTLLNSLSHELRTPLATVIGATDNLMHDHGKLTDDHRKDLLLEISRAGFRLNQQVENLLNMSRLESGYLQLKKDWCDINELIYDVVKKIEDTSPTQTIRISIDEAMPLYKLDKGLMEQVLYNLIYNATLYSGEHSSISVEANSYVDVLQLIIADNGRGFPPSEIENVFGKFYRLNGSIAGGTGLGLSIVKGFVEAHRGTIILRNGDDGGAKFTIEIPAETSHLNKLSNE